MLFLVWLKKSTWWKTNYVWCCVFRVLTTFINFPSFAFHCVCSEWNILKLSQWCLHVFLFLYKIIVLAFQEASWGYWIIELLVQNDLHSLSCTQSQFATWTMKFVEDMNLLNMPSNNHYCLYGVAKAFCSSPSLLLHL